MCFLGWGEGGVVWNRRKEGYVENRETESQMVPFLPHLFSCFFMSNVTDQESLSYNEII